MVTQSREAERESLRQWVYGNRCGKLPYCPGCPKDKRELDKCVLIECDMSKEDEQRAQMRHEVEQDILAEEKARAGR